jgi:hypothetical protein
MTAASHGRLLELPSVGVPPVAGRVVGPWTSPSTAVAVGEEAAGGVGVDVGIGVGVGVGVAVAVRVGVGVGVSTITSMCEIAWQVELGGPVRSTVTEEVPMPPTL